MSERTWTTQQKQAIDADGTVLVSAAAGSGKTAVLVERIIREITRKENPVPADSLVVVTFTIAAAGEIRTRVQQALSEVIAQNPQDRFYRRQQQLLERSHIGTIDSFCMRLVREHFYLLHVSPDLRIGDDSELKALEDEALTRAVREFYRDDEDGSFGELSQMISPGRSDKRLREMILKLYTAAGSRPFGREWLRKIMTVPPSTKPLDTSWGAFLWDYAGEVLEFCIERLNMLAEEIEQNEQLTKAYGDGIGALTQCISSVQTVWANRDWDAFLQALRQYAFSGSIGSLRKADEQTKKEAESIKDTFGEVKKMCFNLLPGYFCADEEEFAQDLAQMERQSQLLLRVILRFWDLFDEAKKERDLVSFSDVMDLTVRLVAKPSSEGFVPTQTAKALSQRYSEILIDEFQDTNEAQDLIFRCLSQEEKNLFMVGDLKQSIYGFRQAMPEIFGEKRAEFAPYDGTNYPARIDLDCNFRSKKTVVNAVNGIFDQLMHLQTGGTEYAKEDRLVAGATYENPEGTVSLNLLIKEAGEDTVCQQGRFIAQKIRELLKNGSVQDQDGIRPVRPGDICIMMRSLSANGDKLRRTLEECGVHAVLREGENLFETPEVAVLISMLTAISNPLLDIPLTHLLMSPLFGFTAEDMGRIRTKERKQPFYLSLMEWDGSDERVSSALNFLKKYREMAAVTTVSRLLDDAVRFCGYTAYLNSMKDGERARANYRLFRAYIDKWEDEGCHNLSVLVRRLSTIEQKGGAPKSAAGTSANGVLITTIHKAKGLEYPICFLANIEKKFNLQDLSDPVLVDQSFGIGMVCRSPRNGGYYRTVAYEATKLHIRRENLSEEMRILYVALTRAREQMYLVGSVSKEPDLNRLPPAGWFPVTQKSQYLDWLLLAANSSPLAPRPVVSYIEEQEVEPETPVDQAARDERLFQEVRRHLQWEYPYQEQTLLPTKFSVTQLVHGDYEGDEFSFSTRPAFSAGGTAGGTAFHKFVQECDPAGTKEDPAAELRRLREAGYLTQEETSLIRDGWIEKFARSACLERMIRAEKLMREYKFITSVNGKTLQQADPGDESAVLLQGVIDCLCISGKQCVLIDYKTDRVNDAEELKQRYARQLELYRIAAEDLLDVTVTEMILYSVSLGEEIVL